MNKATVGRNTSIVWVILTVLGIVFCTEYKATVSNITVDVTTWEKQTFDYDWNDPLDAIFLNNTTIGGNVTVATILANPDECYQIGCYGYYYETKLDIDFPSTRKDSVTQHRAPDGGLFDSTTYHRESTFRFFTEKGKNGTVVCKSVKQPEHNITLHILTNKVQTLKNPRGTVGPTSTNNSESTEPTLTDSSESTEPTSLKVNETADLFFSPKHGGVYCYDKFKDLLTTKTLKMILCSSPSHCDLFQSCFHQNQSCQGTVQNGIECETADCAIIDEGYQTGLAQCKSGEDTETAYFFTGFDKRIYKLSDDIPTRAMITMEEVNPILYTNKPVFIFCSAVGFLFTNDIQFSVMYANGTRSSIPEDHVQPATEDDKESRAARDVVQKGIYVTVTEDMAEIICMAPWYNSTEWFKTSRKFIARDVMTPSIKKLNNKNDTKEMPTKVYLDETRRTLTCSASGQPPPTFTWHRNNQPLDNKTFTQSTTERDSILTLPPITADVEGVYRCIAANEYGSDWLDFPVKIGGISVGAIVWIVITISAVVFIAFGLLWRKYRITKTKLRNLTKNEVDEFENGNPEALALIQKSNENGCEISPANIHLLPFKRDYIISPPDLVVDTTSVLGQGMYGLVMRGKLLGDSVAVKTTKPDADVTYFKALLSEVKVMTYIGVHKNVVHFLGAVTKNIQQRIVYVAIEFSPYGDLESFLKSHRKTFVNLYESKNGKESSVEIEGSFISSIKRVTTLDMLKWSKQIAAGMEYLANKKVVHADLATRNVLLFQGHVAKITDFGLSRQLYEQANYVKSQQAPLPWRWMAIESLRDLEFSTASDVWSYGVTVWEIFSLAETPFPGHTWDFGFMEKLKEGLRMSKPKFASADIYDKVMLNCWNPEPERRPPFEEIQEIFSERIKELESGNYVCEVSSNVNRNEELVVVNNDEGNNVPSSVIYLNSGTIGDGMKNESP